MEKLSCYISQAITLLRQIDQNEADDYIILQDRLVLVWLQHSRSRVSGTDVERGTNELALPREHRETLHLASVETAGLDRERIQPREKF
jgi:hypothetical protein